jgi:hypothetical protein
MGPFKEDLSQQKGDFFCSSMKTNALHLTFAEHFVQQSSGEVALTFSISLLLTRMPGVSFNAQDSSLSDTQSRTTQSSRRARQDRFMELQVWAKKTFNEVTRMQAPVPRALL